MKIDVAAAAVIGGEVKHDLDVLHRLLGRSAVEQVHLEKFDGPGAKRSLEVLARAAAHVVRDADARAPGDQRFRQMGADEGGSSRDQSPGVLPTFMRFLQAHAPRIGYYCVNN